MLDVVEAILSLAILLNPLESLQEPWLRLLGLGLGGLGFGVWGLGFRVQGLGLGTLGHFSSGFESEAFRLLGSRGSFQDFLPKNVRNMGCFIARTVNLFSALEP